MLRVVLCAYRDWAIEVNKYVASLNEVDCLSFVTSKKDYDEMIQTIPLQDVDFILFVGWSWIIKSDILEKCLCLGIHPSDLPMYRGGSPLQHQIIAGLKESKVTLMSLSSEKIDAGDIYAQEVLSLLGNNMDDVFANIIYSSKLLVENFVKKKSTVTPRMQLLSEGSYYKRRCPHESQMTLEMMSSMTLEQIYNFIRASTDPYPNAFMEDGDGNRLLFKQVEYYPFKNN